MTRTGTPSLDGQTKLASHFTVKPELTGNGHAVRLRVMDETEPERLLLAGSITSDQFSAATMLYKDLIAAKMIGPSAMNLSPSISGGDPDPVTQRQALSIKRVNDAIKHLDSDIGRNARAFLLKVVLSETMAQGSKQLALVRLGLDSVIKLAEKRWGINLAARRRRA